MKPLTIFLVASFIGWLLEQAVRGKPHYSAAFSGARVPLLPIYGFGGLLVAGLAPTLRGRSLPTRFGGYALALTGLEYVAGQVRPRQWGYGARGESCVDLPHAATWGLLGLVAEKAVAA